jgi:hypothetical protein
MSNYNLFLDDERDPKDVTWIKLPLGPWVIVRSFESFVAYIEKYGVPAIISFDHDLADEHYKRYRVAMAKGFFDYDNLREKTGYDAAKWLVEYCREKGEIFPETYIHTMNPVGGQNIRSLIDNFKFKIILSGEC